MALFDYQYETDTTSSKLHLTPSAYNALPGTSIDKDKPTQTDLTAFTYPTVPQNFTITVNSVTMTASVKAELGFQGEQSFMLS